MEHKLLRLNTRRKLIYNAYIYRKAKSETRVKSKNDINNNLQSNQGSKSKEEYSLYYLPLGFTQISTISPL